MARNYIHPEKLLESLDKAAASSVAPFHGDIPAVIYSHPTLYPGEQIVLQQDHLMCVDSFDSYSEGVLHLTTFRLMFTGTYCKEYSSTEKNPLFEDAETLSKRGSRQQSASSNSMLSQNEKKNHPKLESEVYKRQDNRGLKSNPLLRHSHSLKKHKNTALDILGLDDPNEPKLVTYKPLANIQHINHVYELEMSIPCTSIYEIRKYSRKNLPKEKSMFLCDGFEILCSHLKSHRFCIGPQCCYDSDSLIKHILYHAKPTFNRLFAFSHKKAILMSTNKILESRDAPNFYKFNSEYIERLDLLSSEEWRVPSHVCELYPMRTLVPSTITDVDLKKASNFHRYDCYPAVCWKHKNGSVMLRSAATITRRGLLESRCEPDEKFLNSVCQINHSAVKNKLVVFVEQPKQSGTGLLNTPTQRMNNATGQLTPEQGEAFYYANCKFVYVESIPDFKTIRQSAFKLQAFLATTVDDSKYLSALEETEWLSQVSELIRTATQAAVAMDCDSSSVLFSYGDGFDRTAQLTSLTQLLLDPYYRTFDGFQILIQKEWLMAFSHRFVDRTALLTVTPDEHSPVFLQFLDCVWQLTQQFPFSFEFNSMLIETIAESVYSCRFGDFLANSDFKKKGVQEKSFSLWTWLNVASMSDPDRFINRRYRPKPSALFPRYNIPFLKIWTSFYSTTFKQENVRQAYKAGQIQGLKLEETYKDLLNKYKLQRRFLECDTVHDSGITNYPNPIYHTTFNISDSSSSLTDSLDDDQSEVLSSLTATLSLDSTNSNDGDKHPRQMTRSRSLDDMLNVPSQKTFKRSSLKRKVGGSKFYTEQLLNELNKEPRKKVVVPQAIEEKYTSLQEYLLHTGVNFTLENSVKVTDTHCCGYLVKQGKIHKNWRKRWFVLDFKKKCLAYFESEKSQHPKGAISYQSIAEVYQDPSKTKKNCVFYIDTPGRTFVIEPPNENNMKIWLACLTIPPNAIEFEK